MDPFRYRSLDAWRGVAALWVVIFHAFASYTNEAYEDYHPAVGSAWLLGHQGWMGVHIFFAVSGYCIAASVASAFGKGRSPQAFLRDRVLRIFPAYWAALIFLIVVGAATAPIIGKSPLSALPDSLGGFLSDIALVQPFFGNDFFLLVSWSLAYEICFYVMSALAMVVLAAGAPVLVVLAVGMLLAVYGTLPLGAPFPLNLWAEFFFGCLAFVCLLAKNKGDTVGATLAAFGLLFLVLLGAVSRESHGLVHFSMAAVTAAGIILLSPWDEWIAKARWLRPLFFLGLISYSLYLVHLVVVSKLMNLSKRFVMVDSLWVLLTVLVATLAAVVCAAIFYRLVECPLEKWRRSLRAPTTK
jgi:peptidoglycan/LPS O-acetylase OafA/YrhL